MATIKKPAKKMQMGGDTLMMKMGGTMAKNGKKFPDLNKDGKITKADILKGRGVIAKKGTKVKKAQNGEEQTIGNKRGNLSSYSQLEPGKKFNYIEGPDRSFGVARRKQVPSGNSKVKTIQYDMGFVPSNARITKQKLDSEGKVIKSKEKSINVNKASRMMKRKGGDYKTGGKVSQAKTGAKMTKTCKYGCK